jgi:rod shape-determining protein MreC
MFIVRRWWDRYGTYIVLSSLALGTAWLVRQTNGTMVNEVYRWVARPLEIFATPEEELVNARILELEARLAEVESQKQQLEAVLEVAETQKQEPTIAPIIGRSADHWWQQMTIGRGSEDGIKVGDVVTGIGGLVGRVEQVTPRTSRILLISDATSRVGVIVSRSRQMGFLRGEGTKELTMQFFEKVPDIRPGDMVSTSPLSRLYPGDVTVGRVKAVNLEKSPAPEATVELITPLGNLEWVYVHSFNPK